MNELRIGLVGGLIWPHAQMMATTLNDSDPEHPLWQQVFGKKGIVPTDRIPRARVTHVWDKERPKAEALAAICGIQTVVDKPEDMIGKVDAVLLPDDTSCVHGRMAGPFLDAGIPTYIDKPLAGTIAEAREIAERAKKGNAPLMTMSCLRYTDASLDLMKNRPNLGAPQLVSALGPDREGKPLHYYGIHIVQVYMVFMGPGAQRVHDVGDHNHHILKLEYPDARKGVIQLSQRMPGYVATGVFTKGSRTVEMRLERSFFRMLQDIILMFRTKTPPVPIDEMLEIIAILSAGEESLASGKPVQLK